MDSMPAEPIQPILLNGVDCTLIKMPHRQLQESWAALYNLVYTKV